MLSLRLGKATMLTAALLGFLCLNIEITFAQENAQLQIPPSLMECYNTSYFMNRANRLPSNIETLITLIEKVENSPDYNQDIRQLSVALLQRFRQDGIQHAQNVVEQPGVIPYSPVGFQFPKFRILLSRLIPGNALQFPNSSLTREERCSLHFMLSSSFDTRVRGDENQVCNRLSQYRAQRLVRSLAEQQHQKFQGSNFMGDVELLDLLKNNPRARANYVQQMRPNSISQTYNPDAVWSDNDYGYSNNNNNNNNNAVSQCPVENGVIRTQWGTVAAGTLIAGIAAGLQQQYVTLRTLLSLSSRRGNMPQTGSVTIDNRWAATLAGDLAEVALVQVPVTETASVGANGAWNSTVMPKWYFLSQRQNLEMTDAEIRGGLDGLILAMNVANWRTQAPNLKLSQLLRMYYSTKGVLGSGIMACNRKDQFNTVAPANTMIAQTSAFAQVLDREMQLHVTLSPESILQFSQYASNALITYVPQYLNDVSCSVSSSLPQDISESITPMTNIYVFLDTSWQYENVVDYVTYILQRLNINPYASTVTMLTASDGTLIVNRTHYLSDVYEKWNQTTHSSFVPGFSLPTILRTVQNLTQSLMNEERTNNSLSGHSLVALLVPYQTGVNEGDSVYSTNQLQYIYEQIPDLNFIYYTGGTVNRFASFVKDPSQDIFALSSGSTFSASSGPVVMRITKTQDPVPNCEDEWSDWHDISNMTSIMTDIFVFLDTTWPYLQIVDYVNYVLQRLNINPYASAVTLLATSNGEVIVNRTHYMSHVYENWNISTHSLHETGFSLPVVLAKSRELTEHVMNYDRKTSSLGGQSLIALIIPSPVAYVTESDAEYCLRYMSYFNNTIPDLNFIFYAGGAVIRFKDYVWNYLDDLYPLSMDIPLARAAQPVVERIRRVPRRIVNPRCGANWWTNTWGPNQMSQLVRLGDLNFYRISSNYFPGREPLRFLKIQPQSSITFTLCTSRSVLLPFRNNTWSPAGVECGQAATGAYSYDLTDACTDYDSVLECPPLYFSVQAQSFGDIAQVACKEPACEFPDEARFLIIVNNLSCNNGGKTLIRQNVFHFFLFLILNICSTNLLSSMNTLHAVYESTDSPRKKTVKQKQYDDMYSMSESMLPDNASSCRVTFVPLRTSTAKPSIKKPIESTKKLKKKLNEVCEENENLAKQIDNKNQEIEELKRSVQSLNDVLQSVPLDQMRADTSIAARQILELSKKNRQFRTELESKKLLLSKRDSQIQKLEKEVKQLSEKLEKDNGDSRKGGKALADLQAKLSSLQQKWFEARNKNVELQEKLKLAGKCLQQEIGDSFDLSKLNSLAAQNSGSWRGRAQQILNLQQMNTELKARIEMLESLSGNIALTSYVNDTCMDSVSLNSETTNDDGQVITKNNSGATSHNHHQLKTTRSVKSVISFDRIAPTVRKSEIMHRAKVEELEKTINELKTQLDEQRGKILALKVRNKALNEDVTKYKMKASALEDLGGEYSGMNLATMNEQFMLQKHEYEARIEAMNHELKELRQCCAIAKTREDELETKLANALEALANREAYSIEADEKIKRLEQDMKSICGDFLFSCRELRKEEFIAILDSLETEKNFLLEQTQTLNQRLTEERTKNDGLSDALSKQKLRVARLEGKVRDLEKELESTGEKKKRLQRITEYASNLSAKSGSLSSFVFENTGHSTTQINCVNDNGTEISDLKQKLELANERIVMLENRLSFLNAEKDRDVKYFEKAIANSKNAILDTILSYRGGENDQIGESSLFFDQEISKAMEA